MSSTLVDPLLWELITLHTNLVNKWLLREFRSRGAPPVVADLGVILKLSNTLDAIQEGGFRNATGDLIEALECIIALPLLSIPEHFRKSASDCLEKVNSRQEEAPTIARVQQNLEAVTSEPVRMGKGIWEERVEGGHPEDGKSDGKRSKKLTIINKTHDISGEFEESKVTQGAGEKEQGGRAIEDEDDEKDKEWVQVTKDERETESGEWDNVLKGDEEVEDVKI